MQSLEIPANLAIEPDKVHTKKLIVFGIGLLFVLLLMAGSGIAGYFVGHAANPSAVPAPFFEAWNLIHKEYVDQPVDDTLLSEGAIRGMIAALGDEHSGYMPPAEYKQAMVPLEGTYTGIGIEADPSGPLLRIIAPFPGSPAAAAGLESGDIILRINGEDLTGVPTELARQKVLGPAGSKVHLSILRDGNPTPLEFDLLRAKIEIPNVQSKMLTGNIAYVRIYVFADTTGAQLHSALTALMAEQPKGLILDLRGNPGGVVTAAEAVASEFLPNNQVITIVRSGTGDEERYRTSGTGLATAVPMIVLVDQGSASSSEMVAGALQDYGRAQLVGMTTYGKGSMQDWHPLANGTAGAVRITIARFFTPHGKTIAGVGIKPNIEVTFTEDQFHAGQDPQLAKAIELLSS
jgi:carboxyl-terminal processing protease